MKNLIKVLKVILPLSLGLYLAWYSIASIENKDKVIEVMSNANYFLIFLSIVFSWLSHYIRSVRYNYLLESMGYQPKTRNSYHAVMIGYFMNLLLPRAGEVSRAGIISRYEKVPFEKAFGAILAERVVDVIMLGSICLITIFLQYGKFQELWAKFGDMQKANPNEPQGINWMFIILIVFAVLAIGLFVLYLVKKSFREKINKILKGFIDGLVSILKLKKRIAFILMTIAIWTLYIALYMICFYSIEETSHLSVEGLMLGFIGGSIGIVLVQGGIGVYPLLVATALSLYNADYDIVIALGWITWAAQTLLLVVAGAISFYLVSRKETFIEN